MSTNTPHRVEGSQVYTIHPVEIHGNVNREFYSSNPQAPPPKYEDVMNGNTTLSTVPQQGLPAGVIVVAPKPSRPQTILMTIFLFIFLFAFVSIMMKIFQAR